MDTTSLAGRPDGWCAAQTRLDLAAFSSGGVGSQLSPIGTCGAGNLRNGKYQQPNPDGGTGHPNPM
jgi:hypothetical protein